MLLSACWLGLARGEHFFRIGIYQEQKAHHGGWLMLSPHTKRVPCHSRILCQRAGILADIAAVDLRINAKCSRRCAIPDPLLFMHETAGPSTPHLIPFGYEKLRSG